MGIFKNIFQALFENGELPEGPDHDGPDNPTPQELLDAEDRCPDVRFVKSCRAFFEKRGFLSDKQKRALTFAGTRNRRSRQFHGDYYQRREDDESMGIDPWD